jgi:hypothetical protein
VDGWRKKRRQKRNEFWNRYRELTAVVVRETERKKEKEGETVVCQIKSSRVDVDWCGRSSLRRNAMRTWTLDGPHLFFVRPLFSGFSSLLPKLFTPSRRPLFFPRNGFSRAVWPVPPPSAGSRLVPPNLWEWSLKHENGPNLMALADIQTGGSGSLLDV